MLFYHRHDSYWAYSHKKNHQYFIAYTWKASRDVLTKHFYSMKLINTRPSEILTRALKALTIQLETISHLYIYSFSIMVQNLRNTFTKLKI
jgi:hypothetical protein